MNLIDLFIFPGFDNSDSINEMLEKSKKRMHKAYKDNLRRQALANYLNSVKQSKDLK